MQKHWPGYVAAAQPSEAIDRKAIADLLLSDGMAQRIRTADLGSPDARRPIVQDLLQRLARQALTSLRPKLVIFDEFQRFRSLFTEGDSEAQALMRTFLQAESAGARVLFLSATPYRMLTLNGDVPTACDHHADFLETISVLYGDEGPAAAEALRQEMRRFRDHLRDFAQGQGLHVNRGLRIGFRAFAENPGRALQKLVAPLLDLVRVDVEILRQLDQGLLALDRRYRDLCLECRAVVPAWSSSLGLLLARSIMPPLRRKSTYPACSDSLGHL